MMTDDKQTKQTIEQMTLQDCTKGKMHMSRDQNTSLLGEPHKRKVTSNKDDAHIIHNTENKLNNVTLNN